MNVCGGKFNEVKLFANYFFPQELTVIQMLREYEQNKKIFIKNCKKTLKQKLASNINFMCYFKHFSSLFKQFSLSYSCVTNSVTLKLFI